MIYGVCSGGTNALAGNKFSGVCAGTGITAAVPYGARDTPVHKGVVAIEPKAALPEAGVIGIEDTIVIRNGQPELLTNASREFLILDNPV